MSEIEKHLTIDIHNLENECIKQAAIFQEYADKLAEAGMIKDQISEEFNLLKAQLDKDIRLFPEKYDIKKTSETLISYTAAMQQSHIQLAEKSIKAKYNYQIMRNIVDSLQMKKSALDNLIKLHGQSYFATPECKIIEKEEHVSLSQRRRNK